MSRKQVVLTILFISLLTIPGTAMADITVPPTAKELAIAMGINPLDIVSATIGTSDPKGTGISSNEALNAFPTVGDTFSILSTGLANKANMANLNGNTSYELAGLNFKNQDLVQVTFVLRPPAKATNLKFDFAFFSEEFPEYIGSSFNDVFIAELAAEPAMSKISSNNGEINSPIKWQFQ